MVTLLCIDSNEARLRGFLKQLVFLLKTGCLSPGQQTEPFAFVGWGTFRADARRVVERVAGPSAASGTRWPCRSMVVVMER